MSGLRLYAPVIVILIWGAAAHLIESGPVDVICLPLLAWALTMHVTQTRRHR